jgi:hypothetical protein
MTNNTNKEKWIDEVMNSTQGMSRADPDNDLLDKITSKLNSPNAVKTTPLPVTQWAAAAILLIALNVGSVIYFTNHNKTMATATNNNPFATEIPSVSTYNY